MIDFVAGILVGIGYHWLVSRHYWKRRYSTYRCSDCGEIDEPGIVVCKQCKAELDGERAFG